MSRIIFVPQHPTPMRYSEWWTWKFPEEFKKADFEVITIGKEYSDMMQCRRGMLSAFSPTHAAIEFECAQIDEYMNLDLRSDDTLFLADLSFPGFFSNVLYHKRPKYAYAFCHATSMNDYDYFQRVRHSKIQVEKAHGLMFNKVFVGSYYHQGKLDFIDIPTEVVGVPAPPKNIIKPVKTEKNNFLISVARPSIQKTDADIELHVEQQYLEMIYRPDCRTWEDYCKALSESQVLLVTAREETFGYQVVDAIINNCIPVVPDAFSYPELVPKEYRYNNITELFDILDDIKAGKLTVPKLLCEARINNFYDNIIKIMRKERDSYPF